MRRQDAGVHGDHDHEQNDGDEENPLDELLPGLTNGSCWPGWRRCWHRYLAAMVGFRPSKRRDQLSPDERRGSIRGIFVSLYAITQKRQLQG
jgi:hypothetical protein